MKRKMKTEEILEKLEEGHEPEELFAILSLTKDQFKSLSDHEDDSVLMHLARQPRFPKELIPKFVNHESEFVRSCIAEHRKLTAEQREKLAEDSDWGTRCNIALNPKTTTPLIIRLSCDEHHLVNNDAFPRLKNMDVTLRNMEKAFDLIKNSDYISNENLKKTFNVLSQKIDVPEVATFMKALLHT